MTTDITVRVAARTDVGNEREHNEDNFLVADLSTRSRALGDDAVTIGPLGLVLAVCDGMGGAAAGEIASDLAVEDVYAALVERSTSVRTARAEFGRYIEEAVHSANETIYADAQANPSRRGMGTTLSAAALVDDCLLFAQVGDSRAYLLRGDDLVQVTRDQSLVAKLLESGALTAEQAETFEHTNIILQALGASPSVVVELTQVELRRGDRLLLCSDGLSGLVSHEEIASILGAAGEPFEMAIELIERAKDLGGHDNVTTVVAFFDGAGLHDDAAPIVVQRFGGGTDLLAIPDPRRLGELLEARLSGTASGTAILTALTASEADVESVPSVPLEAFDPAFEGEGSSFDDDGEPSIPRIPANPLPRIDDETNLDAATLGSSPPPHDVDGTSTDAPLEHRASRAPVVAAALLGCAIVVGAALFAGFGRDVKPVVQASASAVSSATGTSTWLSVASAEGTVPTMIEAAGGVYPSAAPVAKDGRPGAREVTHGAPPRASAPASGSARRADLAPLRDDE